MPSRDAARQFHRDYYDSQEWNGRTHFLGVPTCKPPTDLWAVQQIISTCRPNLIIETGTLYGGTALFYACCMDMAGIDGEVYTIDIVNQDEFLFHGKPYQRPKHPKLFYVNGSSSDPELMERIVFPRLDDDACMVILDSDHSKAHVLAELKLWGPLVNVDQYLIVEDTRIDQPDWMGGQANAQPRPGPGEAVKEWLPTTDRFIVDRHVQPCLTFHPGGYLKCLRP